MSINAELIRYPAEVFGQAKAERSLYPRNGLEIQHCFLDRSWDELHPALKAFGAPLNLALSGDFGYEGGLDAFGWNASNNADHYLAFVSPPLVKNIAVRLSALSYDELSDYLSGPSRGNEYLAPRFRDLVDFYAAAANNQNCVFIHVS
jgi:Domain of unknown function (DUF1877)